MLQGLPKILWLISVFFLATPTFAAECDRNMAEEMNTSIRANFTLLEGKRLLDESEQNKIEMLKENFSEVMRLHDYALESDDQPSLNQACQMYEAILDQQATLGKQPKT